MFENAANIPISPYILKTEARKISVSILLLRGQRASIITLQVLVLLKPLVKPRIS